MDAAGRAGAGAEGSDAGQEPQLQILVEHTSDLITVLDEDGTIRYSNPAAADLTGLSAEQVNGRSAFDLVHPDDRAGAVEAYRDRLATPGRSKPVELRLRFGDGTWHDVEVVVNNRLDDPAVHGVVLTIRDVGDRKRAEVALRDALRREQESAARLRELDELKDEFLATVSHELRTPLTAIAGFVHVLRRRDARLGQAQRDELFERVEANAAEMGAMIEQLLDFSRLEAGRVAIHPAVLPLRPAVDRSIDALGPQLDRHHVVVDVPDELVARFDPEALAHILRNLLTNAAKFSPPATTITVRAGADERSVTVAVDDQGPGVPEADRARIFERFEQGSAGRHPGTGIGLSVARRYVELHGGAIGVTDGPGGGASFWFTLGAS